MGFNVSLGIMRRFLYYWVGALLVTAVSQVRALESTFPSRSKHRISIAFGSCAMSDRDPVIFEEVIRTKADLWIWLGDIVYGDTRNMNKLKAKYVRTRTNPYYAKLLQAMPVIGIWDDHDYGMNDGNKTYPLKVQSKRILLSFLDVPPSNPVWAREGAYQSYTIGQKDKQVKILLLDCRYFQDVLEPSPKKGQRYMTHPTGDILGEKQWTWLERELKYSKAKLNILVSGIQVIAQDHGYEKWANFPRARARLFELLRKTRVINPLILSGDRHIAEISHLKIKGMKAPLYDITSSGLTHHGEPRLEPNQHRTGGVFFTKNFGVLEVNFETSPLQVAVEFYDESGTNLQKKPIFP
jgi:alkaline phosphatase D